MEKQNEKAEVDAENPVNQPAEEVEINPPPGDEEGSDEESDEEPGGWGDQQEDGDNGDDGNDPGDVGEEEEVKGENDGKGKFTAEEKEIRSFTFADVNLKKLKQFPSGDFGESIYNLDGKRKTAMFGCLISAGEIKGDIVKTLDGLGYTGKNNQIYIGAMMVAILMLKKEDPQVFTCTGGLNFMKVVKQDAESGSDDEKTVVATQIIANRKSAVGWLVDYLLRGTAGRLKRQNVDGYLSMTKVKGVSGALVMKFVESVSGYYDDLLTYDWAVERRSDSAWGEYAISRYSSGKLLLDLEKILDEMGLVIASPTYKKLIRNAAKNPHSTKLAQLIPARAKAYAYLYREAIGRPLSDYYQGLHAYEAMPPNESKVVKEYMKKFIALSTTGTGIQEATDITTLTAIASGKLSSLRVRYGVDDEKNNDG